MKKQMDRYLFRGQRADNGEWVYGYYWRDNSSGTHKITVDLSDDNFVCHEVLPETVGQFTGLTDKHEAKVFKDDKIRDLITGAEYIVRFGFNKYGGYTGWYLEPHNFDGNFSTLNADYGESQNKNIEVIGNIHKAEGGE